MISLKATLEAIKEKLSGHDASIKALSVDYIVEQGTSGIWTYRKWNSGIAECWGEYSKTEPAHTNDIGIYVYFPFTFKSAPLVNVGFKGGGWDYYVAYAIGGENTTTTYSRLSYTNNFSESTTITGQIIVKGKWK